MTVLWGTVRAFNAATYTATVQVDGSLSVWLEGVPVARNIPASEMASGRRCLLLLADPANPRDGVLVAVFQP